MLSQKHSVSEGGDIPSWARTFFTLCLLFGHVIFFLECGPSESEVGLELRRARTPVLDPSLKKGFLRNMAQQLHNLMR